MPSSVTLTVSNLPTSTSFFLSALQPLNYGYRGHSNNTIGFGSTTSPSAPPDFWITQEVSGVPAGAARVAFQAPSRIAVQHFFTAALKAGSNIHGEPALRHSSGYYSAAVIDFDGNSIEAVFRPSLSDDKENEVESIISSKTVTKAPSVNRQGSGASKSQAKSCVSHPAALSEAPLPGRRHSGDVIDSIVSDARSVTNVARNLVHAGSGFPPSPYRPSAEGSSNVIFGTVLGVAAGAALHYVFSHDKGSNSRPSANGRSITQFTPAHYQGSQPSGQHHLALEDNDDGSTIRATPRSAASPRRNSIDVQTIYSSGFGNANISPHHTATNPSQRPKMIEERPPSSLKDHPVPRSQPSGSSHHAKAPSTAPSHASRPSRTPDSSDRHSSNKLQALSPSSKTRKNTSTTRTHRTLRTSTYPPPQTVSAAAAATAATVAPLSEANLQRATANPALLHPSPPATTSTSLHPRNQKAGTDANAKVDPLDPRTSRSRSTTRQTRRGGSNITAVTAQKRSQKPTQNLDAEVMPQDSISQVGSTRSAMY